MKKDKIYLLFLQHFDEVIATRLVGELEKIFGLKCEVVAERLDISFAFDKRRNQYHSTKILYNLKRYLRNDSAVLLAIVSVDLYVPSLNFVFGEAKPEDRLAIISLARLRQQFYGLPEDRKLLLERAVKEAVHELGHAFGLSHCSNSRCVMFFSNSLKDTDRKSKSFCPSCSRDVKEALEAISR